MSSPVLLILTHTFVFLFFFLSSNNQITNSLCEVYSKTQPNIHPDYKTQQDFTWTINRFTFVRDFEIIVEHHNLRKKMLHNGSILR